MAYSIVVFAALPDLPEKAWFFSPEQKKAAIIRTAENQTEAKKHRGWKPTQILEAVRDPKYWCVVVFTIAQSVTNAGITNVRLHHSQGKTHASLGFVLRAIAK